MKIFLDCSDVDQIAEAVETGLIDGVTTNPTLIKKSGRDPREVLTEISEMFPWDASISAEVVGDTAEDMLEMADDFCQIGSNITIKLPLTREGLIACKELSDDKISTNVTLCFTAAQAILAAKAGATYISPFIGRLDDCHLAGIDLIQDISEVYVMHDVDTQILAASIRQPHQVTQAFTRGADVVTMPFMIFMNMYNHPLTTKGLEQFNKDWDEVLSR